jgi:hypothetical protein
VVFSQPETGWQGHKVSVIRDLRFGAMNALNGVRREIMRTKFLVGMLLAASSVFAAPRVSIGIGLVLRYCDSSANVITEWISGVGHGETAIDAAPHYSQSLADMADGMAPTSDCGKPLPVPRAPPLLA